MTGAPSLIQRAAVLLQKGPVHTLDVAKEVLGLMGNPGAASAAVFTLLGADSRFSVDPRGHWALVGKGPIPEEELEDLLELSYAVVDVETTGGSPSRGDRITEVAVVEVRDGIISESEDFRTLVNPGRTIPSFITGLTGITDEMVADAPFFEDIAQELYDHLDGRVFVAHNVAFDWRFVSAQLGDAIGQLPDGPRLCTVQMARRLAPELHRRNLDSVASHFGISNHGRHRAYGDALATAQILLKLLDKARDQGIRDLAALQKLLRPKTRRS